MKKFIAEMKTWGLVYLVVIFTVFAVIGSVKYRTQIFKWYWGPAIEQMIKEICPCNK